MSLSFDLRKVPLEAQAKIVIAGNPRDLPSLLASNPSMRHPICAAAYDLGFYEFAVRNAPLLDSPLEEIKGTLVERARSVCDTSAPVDLVVLLSTTPLRNGGRLYPRDESLLRINFADGKVAYCKSRNVLQESTALKLLVEVGLPTYSSAICDGWIVLEGVNGRDLSEHVLLPGPDTDLILSNPDMLLSKIIAIVAFDRIFGMLDRNERGLIITDDGHVTAIDHEYLFVYPKHHLTGEELPMQGKDLLNVGLYLNELGIALSVSDHLEGALEVFRLAQERISAITGIMSDYLSRKPVVELTISQVSLSRDIIANAKRIIEGGPERFSEDLAAQIEEVKRIRILP